MCNAFKVFFLIIPNKRFANYFFNEVTNLWSRRHNGNLWTPHSHSSLSKEGSVPFSMWCAYWEGNLGKKETVWSWGERKKHKEKNVVIFYTCIWRERDKKIIRMCFLFAYWVGKKILRNLFTKRKRKWSCVLPCGNEVWKTEAKIRVWSCFIEFILSEKENMR